MSDDRSGQNLDSETGGRPVAGTEHSWCKAVPIGTGITVLALLLSKEPDAAALENALRSLQNYHPILGFRLRFEGALNTFSFVTPSSPYIRLQPFDLSATAGILSAGNGDSIGDKFHLVLEHELNRNDWSSAPESDEELFYASLYAISESHSALVLRLHTAVCDRASAVTILRELMLLVDSGGEGEGVEKAEGFGLGVEELIPSGKGNKPFWARGVDVLGYSLNSFRLANMGFVDAASPRRSRVLRLQMGRDDTHGLLAACESRGIKLCGALAAAGLIAVRSTKELPINQTEKYAVVTLIDCRPLLEPALTGNHLGFYHSAIMNSHDVSRNETLWELAERCYTSFANAKNNNKHFTDMGDVNFLMNRAIENPGLTSSGSMRTAFVSVFEEPVIGSSSPNHAAIGMEDFVGCSSVHGIGPSIAIFDAVRDGELDCACVYPSPLHSREQMQKLVDDMKRILVDGCRSIENGI